MRLLAYASMLSIVLLANRSLGENICHKKPPGKCEECCQKSNEAGFRESAKESCARLEGIGDYKKAAIDSEVKAYAVASSHDRNHVDPYLFRKYLEEYCSSSGELKFAAMELSYADCAKGCPKPQKESRRKGKGQ